MDELQSADVEATPEVFVCVKWVATRLTVDPVDGSVDHQPHESRFSRADLAAVETGLRLAEHLGSGGVTVICVGPLGVEDSLRDLVASGVDNVMRIETGALPDPADQPSSVQVADAIAGVIRARIDDHDVQPVVVCGDLSADRGSGSVPAFLADALDVVQALGLLDVQVGTGGRLTCTRRLDGGRREKLAVTMPAVISVEGSVADLRRASLAAMVTSRSVPIEVVAGSFCAGGETSALRAYVPRTRVVAPPSGDHALDRIVELTGARTDRTPPRTVTADPTEAASMILEQLREWGYEWATD